MFVALRDIRSARWRFGLMAGVVSLITVLLVMLTALTNGLSHQSTSAVEALPADRVVVATENGRPSFAATLTDEQVRQWADVGTVTPLGIGHVRLDAGDRSQSVAVMTRDLPDGQIVLPRGADVGTVSAVSIGGATVTVAGVEDTQWYSHSPVAWVSRVTFEKVTHTPARSALLVTNPRGSLDDRAGTVARTPAASVDALPGYGSEHGSLLLIQAFLYGICALVVVAFLSVWTVQRTRDLAVLRALGASRGYVRRDALGQAAVLLAAGVGLGAAVAGAGLLGIGSAAPVLTGLTTFAVPVAGVLALGLAGSLLATRRVSRVDPLLALGGN